MRHFVAFFIFIDVKFIKTKFSFIFGFYIFLIDFFVVLVARQIFLLCMMWNIDIICSYF